MAFADEIKEEKLKDEVKVEDESRTSETLKVEAMTVEMVKQELKLESSSTTEVDETTPSVVKAPLDVKEEQRTTASNGSVGKQDDESSAKPPVPQQSSAQEGNPASAGRQGATINASGNEPQTVVNEDVAGEHAQASVVAVMGSKSARLLMTIAVTAATQTLLKKQRQNRGITNRLHHQGKSANRALNLRTVKQQLILAKILESRRTLTIRTPMGLPFPNRLNLNV